MVEAARRLAARFDMEIVAVRAPGLPESVFRGTDIRGGSDIQIVEDGLHPLLASADLAFVASGTATLEAALCGAPMVVLYRTSAASAAIGRLLIQVPWISLVNLVAGEQVVAELIQEDATAARLEEEGERILASPQAAEAMRQKLAGVAAKLGPPGASDRAADAVLEALERQVPRMADARIRAS
jgi:lipid-A-disaccharide synthase